MDNPEFAMLMTDEFGPNDVQHYIGDTGAVTVTVTNSYTSNVAGRMEEADDVTKGCGGMEDLRSALKVRKGKGEEGERRNKGKSAELKAVVRDAHLQSRRSCAGRKTDAKDGAREDYGTHGCHEDDHCEPT